MKYRDVYAALERDGRLDPWLATGEPAIETVLLVAAGGDWRVEMTVRRPVPLFRRRPRR